MSVICVANSKGGTGKTTVSLNLIHHLNPDFIIDLDIHKGLSDLNRLGAASSNHRGPSNDYYCKGYRFRSYLSSTCKNSPHDWGRATSRS